MFLVELVLNIIVLLFLLLFVLIYFITKYKKTIKEINMYEQNFGVVYTKEVLEDMKNIPPECYNYNPVVFVPEYNEREKDFGKSDFYEFLNNEEKEEIEE